MSNIPSTLREAERVLSVAKAALRLHVHYDTVLRWIHDGKLPARQYPSGRYKVPESEILKLENIHTANDRNQPQSPVA